MDKNTTQDRLNALDGLRGVAILLVLFTHIDFYYILSALPAVIRPLGDVLIGSGRTGVSLFFLLSGFLMATYYPFIENKAAFLQKRYTRIFPLFISLVITRTILRAYPSIPLVMSIAALLVPAVIIHFLWVYVIRRINSSKLSRTIFYSFVTLQISIGLLYAFWIMRNPPIYFNQLLPTSARESIIALVNTTLTLPFGKYIPQLDGVYWSLIAEVLFYILYPVLFVPIVKISQGKSIIFKSLLVLSVIPLLLGLTDLSYRILGYAILDIPYFFFFV
ncbi:MAG: acyltransferase family protein, partial [Patescibacteria group bacterium]